MCTNDLVQRKINSLIKLMLTKGIQPSELADNVFLNDYKSIVFNKQNGCVIGELIFEELYGQVQTDVKLRYLYDSKKTVFRIEEELFGVITVLWDRTQKETDLINEIVHLLTESVPSNKVSEFISNLPKELSDKIQLLYGNIA